MFSKINKISAGPSFVQSKQGNQILYLVLMLGMATSFLIDCGSSSGGGGSPSPVVCQNEGVDTDSDGLIDICMPEQLNNIRYNLSGTSYKTSSSDTGLTSGCPATGCRGYELVADIDLGNSKWGMSASFTGTGVVEGWEPIGACSRDGDCTDATDTPFTATFEGRGFVIRNLYINRPSNPNETGLFGATSGTLSQIGLENVAVRGNSYTGSLVGVQNGGRIRNSYATGAVTGASNVGGLVGRLVADASLRNSYATSTVTGETLGGLHVGGLVGDQRLGGTISNSYATGAVTNTGNNTGGLVGTQSGPTSTIMNTYATGMVTSSTPNKDGLVGFSGTITNSYWDQMTTGISSSSSASGTTGLTTVEMKATSAPYPNLLGSCFKFTLGKYPQLYAWDASTSACTTTLLGGSNAD